MTLRLTLGIDPGQSGAIAMLADGHFAGFVDMPISARKASGNEINAAQLAALLRGVMQTHQGAYMLAVVEQVNAMPSVGAKGAPRRPMGASSAFRFGESFGVLKGVLAALGLGYILIEPRKWKEHAGLIGREKDVARTVACQRFPACAEQLQRKKDVGRADALLLAHYAEATEQVAKAA